MAFDFVAIGEHQDLLFVGIELRERELEVYDSDLAAVGFLGNTELRDRRRSVWRPNALPFGDS